MKLCLANGQRIKLRPQMRMLFEVQDLKVASPATVSRCGMVYLTQEELGWKPYVYSWIERCFGMQMREEQEMEILDQERRKQLVGLFEEHIDEILAKIRSSMKETITTVDLQLVCSLCNLLEAFISEKFGFKQAFTNDQKKVYLTWAFVFGLVWSLGAALEEKYHEDMNFYLRDKFQYIFPNVDLVYSYCFDTSGPELSFKHWNDRTPEFKYDPLMSYSEMLVPTIDTVRYSFIVDWLLSFNKLVYVTGAAGTGKSVIVASLLGQVAETRSIDSAYLIFSAQTTSLVTQMAIEGKLEKIKKTLLGAKPGRTSCIFIDDVNMPALEEYGAQPPIELLRLLVDKQFVYDRKERFQKFVENTTFLCCSAPPGGGRNPITQRFTRHFNMLSLPQPTQPTLFKIFHSILSGFFSQGFTDAVKRQSDVITYSTIEVYQKIIKDKLPVPSKFHYTFNLRDVAKVFQGMLMVRPAFLRESEQINRLWIHEVSRVFHDRLINEKDRDWFKETIIELLGRQFKSRWERGDVFDDQKILFGDLLRLDSDNKEYEEIKDMAKLCKVLEEKLEDFNMDFNSKEKLVFFDDAIDHILRISRVLRQPRGNAMLIGVGGSGKQSLTRLSSYMLEYQTKSIEITKNYSVSDFHDFIKEIMKGCGVDLTPISFLFTDSQIVYESFLEDINNILNSGEVPNLWKSDEKDPLINAVRPINAKLKRPEDPDTIYKTFVEGVRNNLHIILCMSPVGDNLRVRCRKFPALVDCCTLDWFSDGHPQPSSMSLSCQNLEPEELVNNLAEMCKEIHITSKECAVKFENALKRKVYTTPKSYLDLIGLYLNSLKRKREELTLNQKRLSSGLTKLEQANKQVAELQISLTELQPQLEEQSIKVTAALQKVEADSRVAAEKESVVQREAEEVNKKAQDIKLIADDAQAELKLVIPELEKAQKALQDINKNDLNQIRSYLQPPAIVQLVLEGVCILLGVKTDWATAKSQLQDVNGFIQKLLGYPSDSIPEDRLIKLRKILAKEEFNPESIRQRASAAADLCQWCIAMNTYSVVNKKVEPKKRKVAELEANLSKANKILQEKESELDIVKQAVQKLKKETDEMLQKKMDLERLRDLTEARLERAQKLITLTKDEAKRWAETVETLGGEIENLIGDVFLSAAAISYNGPFTGVYRQELVSGWVTKVKDLNIPVSENFSVIKTLGDPMQLRDWCINGLPSDTVSQENSIFATQGYRWPLMIDPQLQANNWIKGAFKQEKLKPLKFSETGFQMNMKLCITNGYPVLIQDLDETVDPSIDTILGKQYKETDGRVLIRFGDQDIDFDQNFKLFLTTKIPNPNYLPEIFIKVTVINFTVTFEGLEEQLLADVVKLERPEIEQQKDDNVMNLAAYRKSIKESETTILRQLADAEAEKILDNVDLIASLEYAKNTAIEINEKIAESVVLEEKIEKVRNEYKSVSIRGSVLYFVIKDLNMIDPMYQYSLQYIQQMFNKAMRTAEESKILDIRLQNLIQNITSVIYTNVCRGLFEKDKLIFSFLIAVSINRQARVVTDKQWMIFLRGTGIMDAKKKMPANPDKTLISDISWEFAYYLEQSFDSFSGFTGYIAKNMTFWKEFIKTSDPIQMKLEDPWENRFDPFEHLLVIKIFRSEKILFALSDYVRRYMGQFYLESPKVSMDVLYRDSDVYIPIIFVLSRGADPTSQVLKYAKEKDQESKIGIISLGQGQGKIAKELIADAKLNGKWVLLQNCHLMKTWMPTLEQIVEQTTQTKETVHPDYRLYLTSMPVSNFPVSILQNGIKLTTEPPRGMKANLKRSFQDISDDFLDACPKRELFHKLAFGVCYFHAILQERKKFGPLGWNIKYEFNDSDLDTSKTVIKMLLSEGEVVPWDAMLFVSGQINYGGRVQDDWDRRCLITILKKFITPEITDDNYKFSENPQYYVPPVQNIESYVQYIETLPLADDPQVFGMHENANITFQQQESDIMIRTMLSIQPKAAGGGDDLSPDKIVLKLVKDISDELPQQLKKEDGQKELWIVNEKGLLPSLSTVLLQETTRFNTLLSRMAKTLVGLAKAIEGIEVMSQELDEMYFSLLNNLVPGTWVKVSYLSLKGLGSWIRDLKERIKAMAEWLTTGGPNCFWISGFFYPQGFLTGVLQTHARKTGIAIDVLQFSFKIQDVDKETCSVKPLDGVYIYGLYLEGAQWKKKTLADLNIGQMHYLMPVIHFHPIENYQQKPENYSCPVYKTTSRAGTLSTTGQSTNYVLAVVK